MSWIFSLFFILAVVLIVFAVIAKQSSKKGKNTESFQYQKLDALFSPAERSFFGVIKLAVNEKGEVLGKIRVADVITPKKGQQRSDWQRSFNKISSKHFDFLICNKDDLSPICAIELNDKSHNSKSRKERDRFLEAACKSAGLPLLQVPAKSAYQVTEIRALISKYISQIESPETTAALTDIAQERLTKDRVCPKCASNMAIKVAKKGKNFGKEFWACSAFPKCRHIESK